MSRPPVIINTRYENLSRKKTLDSKGKMSLSTENVEELNGKSKETAKIYSVPIRNEMNNYHDYLNCLIHIFFYLKEIRLFIMTEDITTDPRYMIFSELRTLYEKYEELLFPESRLGEKFRFLDPFELRREISYLYSEEKKFKMNESDDISDLFYIFFNAFHSYTIGTNSLKYVSDKECPKVCLEHNLYEMVPCPHTCENFDKDFRNVIPKVCISHNLFYFNLIEQDECECGAVGEVLQGSYFSFIYEVDMKKIIPFLQTKDFSKFKYKFFEIMRTLMQNSAICPQNKELCSSKAKRNIYIVNTPKYFLVSMNWKEINPKLFDICKVFFLLSHQFKMPEIFEPTVINARTTRKYDLFCLICYWNCHYVSYIRHESGEEVFWIKNNDMTVTRYTNFTDVVIDCMLNHFHPVMLFYRRIDNDKGLINENKEYINDKQMQNIIDYCEKTDNNSLSKYNNDKPNLRPDLSIKSVNSSMNEFLKRSKEIKSKGELFLDESFHKNRKDSEFEFKTKNTMSNVEEKQNVLDVLGFSNEKFFTKIKQNFSNENNIAEFNDKLAGSYNFHLNANEGWICDKCNNVNRSDKAECIKCKNLNSSLHEYLIQNKYDRTNKKNLEEKFQQNPINPVGRYKGGESVFLVCENCNQSNFCTKIKCEFCQKNLASERSGQIHTDRKHTHTHTQDSKNTMTNLSKKDKISSAPTILNIPNTPANLGVFNIDNLFSILQSIKESSYKNINDKKELLSLLPMENFNLSRKWICSNCQQKNEKILEYCEFCFKNNDNLMSLLSNAAKIIFKKKNHEEKTKSQVKNSVEYISNITPVECNDITKRVQSKSPSTSPKKVKFLNLSKEFPNLQMKSVNANISNAEDGEIKFNERSVQNLNIRRSLTKNKIGHHIEKKI